MSSQASASLSRVRVGERDAAHRATGWTTSTTHQSATERHRELGDVAQRAAVVERLGEHRAVAPSRNSGDRSRRASAACGLLLRADVDDHGARCRYGAARGRGKRVVAGEPVAPAGGRGRRLAGDLEPGAVLWSSSTSSSTCSRCGPSSGRTSLICATEMLLGRHAVHRGERGVHAAVAELAIPDRDAHLGAAEAARRAARVGRVDGDRVDHLAREPAGLRAPRPERNPARRI